MIPLLLSALLAAAPATGGLPVNPAWSLDPVWDDGLAEVALYDARRVVYGVERRFETVAIVVKEDFDRARGVKADPPYGDREILTVLKMNLLSRIETGNYPYSFMTSLFVRRDAPGAVVKAVQSSQEWCGTTFKELREAKGRAPRLEYHSYFDGEGDGGQTLDLGPGALLEEQLMISLRAGVLEDGVPRRVSLYTPIITHTARPLELRAVTIAAFPPAAVETPAGRMEARRTEVRADDPARALLMTWWIGTGPMRPIVKMESADGRGLLLRSISRRNYWERAGGKP